MLPTLIGSGISSGIRNQVWIDKVCARPQELECPAETTDYQADPADITRRRPAPRPREIAAPHLDLAAGPRMRNSGA
jgi:hypothetical protein